MTSEEVPYLYVDQFFLGELDGIEMLVMGNEASGVSFSIKSTRKFDDQDVEMGMDTYCLCDSEGRTHYGGLGRIEIMAGRLLIRLDERASEVFGQRELMFVFSAGLAKESVLREYISYIKK